MNFGREKVIKHAKELIDLLQVVENVKSLQTAQKELSDALRAMGDRIGQIESEVRILKAETKFEALKETQSLVNSVQSGLNQRIEGLAIKVAVWEQSVTPMRPVIDGATPVISALLNHDVASDGQSS